ncbi:unnamed protein product [Leuciscus chuanchicus]
MGSRNDTGSMTPCVSKTKSAVIMLHQKLNVPGIFSMGCEGVEEALAGRQAAVHTLKCRSEDKTQRGQTTGAYVDHECFHLLNAMHSSISKTRLTFSTSLRSSSMVC